jgi:hypothetical protein
MRERVTFFSHEGPTFSLIYLIKGKGFFNFDLFF